MVVVFFVPSQQKTRGRKNGSGGGGGDRKGGRETPSERTSTIKTNTPAGPPQPTYPKKQNTRDKKKKGWGLGCPGRPVIGGVMALLYASGLLGPESKQGMQFITRMGSSEAMSSLLLLLS